jgi:hypothetical protein
MAKRNFSIPMSEHKAAWDQYVIQERARLLPLLTERDITLDQHQPNLIGERYLMQAISTTSGKKITLFGTLKDGARVVIKATSDELGATEIEEERVARRTLDSLQFAAERFYTPREVHYSNAQGLTVSIQEYIVQDSPFIERPLTEQFALALKGFKTQEGAHATTYSHMRTISNVFHIWESRDYCAAARAFAEVSDTDTAYQELVAGTRTIDQYTGFLTHSDFVPHNFRVKDGHLYLLDHSSLRFGNKYESWARFINFMVLYNPPLADALLSYVMENRLPNEYESLRLMRIYRAIEITAYYTRLLARSEGSLKELNAERVAFWRSVLTAIVGRTPLEPKLREAYVAKRDALRSPDEKLRQQGLH